MPDAPPKKQFAPLDFGDAVVAVKKAAEHRPQADKATKLAAAQDAKEAGFTTRAEAVKIDGRTLRKTGRTAQLNVRVTPETRDAFILASARFPSTEEFIRYLLDKCGD
jgi:hypothetical protein